MVERDFPGFSVGKKEDKLGIRASSTCELILEDVRVPRANVVSEVGQGYKVAIETLDEGRIGIGAQMVGLAQGAFEAALAYSKERKQFGKAIADSRPFNFSSRKWRPNRSGTADGVQHGADEGSGQSFVRQAAMTKYFCSQVGERVASQALEFLAASVSPKIFPLKSSTATPRLVRSTKALQTSSCKLLPERFWKALMAQPTRIVSDTMAGLRMPDFDILE